MRRLIARWLRGEEPPDHSLQAFYRQQLQDHASGHIPCDHCHMVKCRPWREAYFYNTYRDVPPQVPQPSDGAINRDNRTHT